MSDIANCCNDADERLLLEHRCFRFDLMKFDWPYRFAAARTPYRFLQPSADLLFRGSPRFDINVTLVFHYFEWNDFAYFLLLRKSVEFCRRIWKINFIGTYRTWWISTNSRVLGWMSIRMFKGKSLGNCEEFWRLYFTVGIVFLQLFMHSHLNNKIEKCKLWNFETKIYLGNRSSDNLAQLFRVR